MTHTELLWQPTTHTKSGENRRHAIPGHEFSGTIAAICVGADGIVGQEVFGMNDWYAQGATAELRWTEIDWKSHGYELEIHLIREKKA